MINTELPRIPHFPSSQNDEIGGLSVDFIPDNGLMFVIIANYETFALRNCRISFSQTLPTVDGKKLNHLKVFKSLDYLAPGRRIPVFVGESISFLEFLRDKKITIHIKYKLPDGASKSYSINHDLSIYEDLPQILNKQNYE